MSLHPFLDATKELLWSFFPVFIVVFVLFLFGKTDSLLYRSDLILVAAVLWAEGWARTKKASKFERPPLIVLGFFGSMISVVLAVMMLLNEIGEVKLSHVIDSWRFSVFYYPCLIGAVLYGWWVRVRANLNPFAGHDNM